MRSDNHLHSQECVDIVCFVMTFSDSYRLACSRGLGTRKMLPAGRHAASAVMNPLDAISMVCFRLPADLF